MKLIPDWWRVLRYAWSVRLMALAALLTLLEVMLPLMSSLVVFGDGVSIALSIGSGLSAAGAFVARLVAQKGFSRHSDA